MNTIEVRSLFRTSVGSGRILLMDRSESIEPARTEMPHNKYVIRGQVDKTEMPRNKY